MGLKSIFDGLYVDQLIRKEDSGAFVVYPHGMLGRGYALPAEREPAMRRRLRAVMLVALVIPISCSVLLTRIAAEGALSTLDWLMVAASGVLLLSAISYWQSRIVAGLVPAAGQRMSKREWLRRGRQSRPGWTLWFSAILGGFLAVTATATIIVGVTDQDWLAALSGLFLLIVGTALGVDGVVGMIERGRLAN